MQIKIVELDLFIYLLVKTINKRSYYEQ